MDDQAFENMIGDLVRTVDAEQDVKISQAKYRAWRREYTWLGIQGQRYGQSFCNKFGITNYVLWYITDWTRADELIKSYYLENA